MRRARRWALGIAASILGIAIAIPSAYRAAAASRETERAADVAPRGGWYVEADGLAMFHEELGSGPPVVMVPGTMAWSGTYVDLMERLAAAGFRAIAIDLPPFGYSERPREPDYGREAQARRIVATADALGLERFALVGHSFGGGATVEAAMSIEDRIDALVLLDAALALAETEARAPPLAPLWSIGPVRSALTATTLTNPSNIPRGLRAFVFEGDRVVTDARVAIYARPLSVEGTTPAVGWWIVRALYADERAARSHHEDAYRAFDRPTLVVWGREDTITPLAEGEHVASLLPRSELVVLDRVGHIPHVEDADAVASHVVRFLRAPR